MPNTVKVGDIFFFEEYDFTDTQKRLKHFGLTILPPTIFESSAHFCVITSKKPRANYFLVLLPSDYKCFSKDTFVCFDSVDLEKFDDTQVCKYRDTLKKVDMKRGLRLIYKCISLSKDCYLENSFKGAVLREWKKRIVNL